MQNLIFNNSEIMFDKINFRLFSVFCFGVTPPSSTFLFQEVIGCNYKTEILLNMMLTIEFLKFFLSLKGDDRVQKPVPEYLHKRQPNLVILPRGN